MSKFEQRINELVRSFPHIRVPRDETEPQYAQSFDYTQADNIKAFFEEFGFVVIRGS